MSYDVGLAAHTKKKKTNRKTSSCAHFGRIIKSVYPPRMRQIKELILKPVLITEDGDG